MEVLPRTVVACQTDEETEPFTEWLDTLDPKTEAIAIERVDRLERGLFGDCEPVGDGVYELRIDVGPGYRIYFGLVNDEVHLIRGGKKKGQQKDIDAAKEFWNEHD